MRARTIFRAACFAANDVGQGRGGSQEFSELFEWAPSQSPELHYHIVGVIKGSNTCLEQTPTK